MTWPGISGGDDRLEPSMPGLGGQRSAYYAGGTDDQQGRLQLVNQVHTHPNPLRAVPDLSRNLEGPGKPWAGHVVWGMRLEHAEIGGVRIAKDSKHGLRDIRRADMKARRKRQTRRLGQVWLR